MSEPTRKHDPEALRTDGADQRMRHRYHHRAFRYLTVGTGEESVPTSACFLATLLLALLDRLPESPPPPRRATADDTAPGQQTYAELVSEALELIVAVSHKASREGESDLFTAALVISAALTEMERRAQLSDIGAERRLRQQKQDMT